ncbi:unnamed protein product, partial [Porites lobata]
DESEDEEPRIKDVLSHLSRKVSEKRASDLLHSMAASKDILSWTPSGLLLRNKRTIPLGIDKGLIKNKKLLSDLIEKGKGYRNVENTSDNESNNDESSCDIENQEEEEEEEVASENGVETEGTQER